jgi:hypothetical protein
MLRHEGQELKGNLGYKNHAHQLYIGSISPTPPPSTYDNQKTSPDIGKSTLGTLGTFLPSVDSNSWAQVIFLPQPPKYLTLQAHHTAPNQGSNLSLQTKIFV